MWRRLGTAWRRHPFSNKRIGLHYPSVPPVMAAVGIKKKHRGRVWDGLWEMELAALEAWAEAED